MKPFLHTLLPVCILLFSNATLASNLQSSFSSAEHIAIGDNVSLYFSANDAGQKNVFLSLPNGLSLTYGDIVAAGDFYGVLGKPISQGKNDAERRSRFLAAFAALALSPSSVDESLKIRAVIRDEQKMLEDGIKAGKKPEDIYNEISHENDRKLNCITGGGCEANTWFLYKGRYLQLANENYDHFADNAWLAYKTGHQIALEKAVEAQKTKNISMLAMAYQLNAFACHFLSDRFSSGHMRTPRIQLVEQVSPSTIGSLLAKYMHDEDNANGLHVHNTQGNHWIAYGDNSYYSEKSIEHRRVIAAAMQSSANQVFTAYQQGSTEIIDDVEALIPIPDETLNASNSDISPLFYWDKSKHKLMRRAVIENLYDREWTDSWWGWSTLIELKRLEGISLEAQATLATSPWRDQAIKDDLLTDPTIILATVQYS